MSKKFFGNVPMNPNDTIHYINLETGEERRVLVNELKENLKAYKEGYVPKSDIESTILWARIQELKNVPISTEVDVYGRPIISRETCPHCEAEL